MTSWMVTLTELQPILLYLPIQRSLADAEHGGRLFAVAAGDFERFGDEQCLDVGERFTH